MCATFYFLKIKTYISVANYTILANISLYFKGGDQVEQPENDDNLTIIESTVVSKPINGIPNFFSLLS